MLPSLSIRRFLYLPALIKNYYYDFFSQNDFLYFSAGQIGKLFRIPYTYELPPPYLMGNIYFGNPNTGANTGYIADAYANFGLFGMLIITMLLVITFKILDSLAQGNNYDLIVGMTIPTIIALNDVAYLTTMLTGGALLLIVILYLYQSATNKELYNPKIA